MEKTSSNKNDQNERQRTVVKSAQFFFFLLSVLWRLFLESACSFGSFATFFFICLKGLARAPHQARQRNYIVDSGPRVFCVNGDFF